MAQIHFFIDDTEHKQIQEKAQSLGFTTAAFARHILKEAVKSSRKDQVDVVYKNARVLTSVMAEAFGRTHGASPEDTYKLKQVLLKIFDQEQRLSG